LPPGETGEIVVTTLTRGWPMIRFGTGDVSQMLEVGSDGGAARLAPLQGRVGGAVKAREIFIYPGQVATLAASVPGIERLALTVTRPGSRDEITARILPVAAANPAEVEAQLRQAFPAVTRLKLDHVTFAGGADSFGEPSPIADER
jgi:phenylacetate-CoA ligase